MKKFTKNLTLSGLTILAASSAFAQKSCDLALTLISPAAATVYNFNDNINIKFDIKNNGPAAIAANDTIFYLLPFGGTQSNPGTIQSLTGVAVASGGTTTVDLGPVIQNINATGTDQTVDFCIKLLAQNTVGVNGQPATTTYTDAVAGNDQDCSSITLKTKPTSIFDVKGTKETLSLFPNPATSQVSFNLALEQAEAVSAVVRDLTGREVMSKDFGKVQTGITSSVLELNIANLNNGIYVVEVIAGDKKFIGKITKKD
ncbi:MAG: hypothetical protein BGO31_06410 [Bacteroidetes bacterium 43-16]|nr:MAG: hypothetical protein BGO31_06410 [Bacteroidetes bacterium 43-16]